MVCERAEKENVVNKIITNNREGILFFPEETIIAPISA